MLLKFASEDMLQWAGLLYLSCDFEARRFGVSGSPDSGFPTGVPFSSLMCHPKEAAARLSLLGLVAVVCPCMQGSHSWLLHRVSTVRQQLHSKPAAWRKAPLKSDLAQPGLAVEVGTMSMSLIGYKCTSV